MKKLSEFLKHTFLPFGIVFLILFIPLYPKLPLFDIVQTWVYIRLEDFIIATLVSFYLLSLWLDRRISSSPLSVPIHTYWFIGGISALWSMLFIGPSLLNYFPHLVILHYLRRIEYMSLFFIAYDVVRQNPKIMPKIIWSLVIVAVAVFVYGMGQKLAGWPAFLTMNEEFSKGVPLRLPPTARIPSTFGGHYDLAAYLVLLIPILGSLFFGVKKFWQKAGLGLLTLTSYVLLLFTASRVSFGVYLVAISAMLVWQKKKWLILPVIIVSFILLNFVGVASDRFYKTLRYSDVVIDLSTGKPIGTLDRIQGGSAYIQESQSPAKENLPTGSGFISVPGSGKNTAVNTVELFRSRDLATGSGEVATISGSFLIQKALVFDISITTRFQAEWPMAMEAFKRNILLGSGYSTLSVASDGEYHRMLGETGLLGAITFLGILFISFYLFFKAKDKLSGSSRAFVIGVFAGLVGLLLNAILIDVFEASKVAFSFWIILGIAVALLAAEFKEKIPYFNLLWRLLTHPILFVLYLVIAVFLLFGNSINQYFIGDDFTWLRWSAQSSVTDILHYFTDAGGFFYRPIPKLVYFALFSVFWLKPEGYHVAMLLLYAGIVITLYGIQLRLKIPRILAWLWSGAFLTLSIHHENVYWISGLSSLLATLFICLSIYCFLQFWQGHRLGKWMVCAGSVFLLLSMLSHDSMSVGPVLIVILGFFLYGRKKIIDMLPLVFIPLYWWMRISAGAFFPSGNYGYNESKFLVNSLGNLMGYIVAIPFGPKAIDAVQTMRGQMRLLVVPLTFATGIVVVAFGALTMKVRHHLKEYRIAITSLVLFILSLSAYLGLGGIAERNAIIPSVFFILFLSSLSVHVWNGRFHWIGRAMVLIVIGVLMGWNARELWRVSSDWQKASEITKQSLLKIKDAFFPIERPTTFAFVNTPIRYGHAWIFPTGIPDALWLMFRDAPFYVIQPSLIEEAFRLTENGIDRQVLIFEDYVLKKAVKEIIPVENQ